MGEEQLVLRIDGNTFSANLDFSNEKLISFYIDYKGEGGNFTINGADIVVTIGNYHYIPEKKDLLKDFNEATVEKFREKITKRDIDESEAKQLLLELLDYINNATKGVVADLIEKVKNTVKSESVRVKFSSESYTVKSPPIELEGIDKLRKGALILILLVPILLASDLLLLVSIPLSAVVSIIGVILGIIGLLNIRGGFRILYIEIGHTGATLYFASLVLVFIGAILPIVMAGNIMAGLDVIILGAILAVISNILIGIGFYRVGGEYNERTTKIGGILAAIPIIAFIGYIMVYVGLDKIKLTRAEMLGVQP